MSNVHNFSARLMYPHYRDVASGPAQGMPALPRTASRQTVSSNPTNGDSPSGIAARLGTKIIVTNNGRDSFRDRAVGVAKSEGTPLHRQNKCVQTPSEQQLRYMETSGRDAAFETGQAERLAAAQQQKAASSPRRRKINVAIQESHAKSGIFSDRNSPLNSNKNLFKNLSDISTSGGLSLTAPSEIKPKAAVDVKLPEDDANSIFPRWIESFVTTCARKLVTWAAKSPARTEFMKKFASSMEVVAWIGMVLFATLGWLGFLPLLVSGPIAGLVCPVVVGICKKVQKSLSPPAPEPPVTNSGVKT